MERRGYTPLEYQDETCSNPHNSVVERVKKDKKEKQERKLRKKKCETDKKVQKDIVTAKQSL